MCFLQAYLQILRTRFSRLYLLSDSDLLYLLKHNTVSSLSQTSSSSSDSADVTVLNSVVCSLLTRCFGGIKEVRLCSRESNVEHNGESKATVGSGSDVANVGSSVGGSVEGHETIIPSTGICEVVSHSGEVVKLVSLVKLDGVGVEVWMSELDMVLKKTLKSATKVRKKKAFR